MSQSAAVPILEARDVSFAYQRPVVSDVSLALTAGTLTGIVGPNGSGKTTVLRLLAGILKPASGRIFLDGAIPIDRLPRREIARRIAMVPQSAGNGAQLTVMEFALQGRAPHLGRFGFESARDEEITMEALEMSSLAHYRDRRISELSGGEKQRLLLARALAQQSQVLLLDELTANLDINYQVELMRLVRRLTGERRIATLVVSHEIHLLARFSDRIALMADGRIQGQGEAAEVITRENLSRLFHLDFTVRSTPAGEIEVLPVIQEWSHS
jgi:iron complex transport system ATP-binding protein